MADFSPEELFKCRFIKDIHIESSSMIMKARHKLSILNLASKKGRKIVGVRVCENEDLT